MNAIDHILVVCEDSRAGRRALRSAAAVADEHRARISVISMINPERRTVGCCMRSDQWNRILDEVAHEQLDSARGILGERDPAPRFEIVPAIGSRALRRVADRLGCDLVLVPVRGFFAGWSVRRLRRGMRADIRGVRSA